MTDPTAAPSTETGGDLRTGGFAILGIAALLFVVFAAVPIPATFTAVVIGAAMTVGLLMTVWPATTRTDTGTPAAERLWRDARDRHREVLSEYGAYELDPALFLRYPGVVDVTREPVMDFHTALAEANALATDDFPDDASFADDYRKAVDRLRRAWVRSERSGKAAGTGYLAAEDAADLATAAKLYAHAQSSERPGEQAAYLDKVRDTLADLDSHGRLQPPVPILEAIEQQTRRALEA